MITNQVARQNIIVGLGELAVSKDSLAVLSCVGLGSCIALCAYDPVSRIGALAHMLLPNSRKINDPTSLPTKYVDSGVPYLVQKMIKQGASKSNLIF